MSTLSSDIWYSVEEYDSSHRFRLGKVTHFNFRTIAEVETSYDLTSEDDAESCAEQCAQDFHSSDGWECGWPITISLFDSEFGPEMARSKVNMDMVPEYSASYVKQESEEDLSDFDDSTEIED